MHIDREDMLELTRRMTIARNCFNRVAGAYMDEEGFIDGSFNTHFLKLSPADKEKQLAIAKTIPYAKTNEQLKNFRIDSRQKKPGSIWHLLTALRDCDPSSWRYVFRQRRGQSFHRCCRGYRRQPVHRSGPVPLQE